MFLFREALGGNLRNPDEAREPAALRTWSELLPKGTYKDKVSEVANAYLNLQQGQQWLEFFSVGGSCQREALQLQCASGPAVVLASQNLGLVWVLAAVLPWIACLFCTFDPDEPNSYATYPFWIWVPCLLIIAKCLSCEWECLKYAIVPQLQVVGQFEILGFNLKLLAEVVQRKFTDFQERRRQNAEAGADTRTTIVRETLPGATKIRVQSVIPFELGRPIYISNDTTSEVKTIVGIVPSPAKIIVDSGLKSSYGSGASVKNIKGCCKHLQYYIWLGVTFSISFLTHLDVLNNGLFLAVTLVTMWSDHGKRWEEVWYTTVAQSHLPWMFAKFHVCVFFAWALMFLQVIVAVLSAIPVPRFKLWTQGGCFETVFQILQYVQKWQDVAPRSIDYSLKDEKYAQKLKFHTGDGHLPTYYQAMTDRRGHYSDHGHVLIVLAETGRMATLAAMRDEYVEKKVTYYLDEMKDNSGPRWAAALIYRFLTRACVRTIFQNIFTTALTSNLQASLLCMTHLLIEEGSIELNWHTLTTLRICLWVGVPVHIKNICREGRRWYFVNSIISAKVEESPGNDKRKYFDDGQSKTLHRRNKLCSLQFLFFVCLYLYWLMIEYCCFKWSAAAMGWCPDKMWNFSGCVHIRTTSQTWNVDTKLFVAYVAIAFVPVIAFVAPHLVQSKL